MSENDPIDNNDSESVTETVLTNDDHADENNIDTDDAQALSTTDNEEDGQAQEMTEDSIEGEVIDDEPEEAKPLVPMEFLDSEFTGLHNYVEGAYLDYAMYVIMDRALPHVGDGLKPVHRRILYAMHELKLTPSSKYKKSARTIGDVLGKYHPHGDSACYEAMVMMAQPFSSRNPLVDGQGNWGSPDDPKSFAAMRYTESKLTKYSSLLLDEIDPYIVDWEPNFDGSLDEPSVMPAKLPNVLINGGSGIAVGIATDILPHNLREVASACIRLIDDPDASLDEIMEHIKGPDFPLGGNIISSKSDIKKAYETGRGSVRVRAKYRIEDDNIVIYELPYRVSGSKVIEKIAEQMQAKRLPMVEDISDESDQDEMIRLVITPKKKTNKEQLMQHLFATTDLETSHKINMNVINMKDQPETMNLLGMLNAWLEFRRQCVYRRTEALLKKTNDRLHLLEAYEKVFNNIDLVIDLIRNSDEPQKDLEDQLGLSEIQARHILEIRLRSLAKLEEYKILEEKEMLLTRKAFCESVIGNPVVLDSIMRDEIEKDSSQYDTPRRSTFVSNIKEAKELSDADITPAERITVIVSNKGWIKAGKGTLDGKSMTYKSGDSFLDEVEGMSNQIICVMDNKGKVYNIPYSEIPSARGYGEPLSSKVNIGTNKVVSVNIIHPDQKYLIASDIGYGFVGNGSVFATRSKAGKGLLTVGTGTPLKPMKIEDDHKYLMASNTSNKAIVFPIDEIKELDKGKGVQLIKMAKGDHLNSIGLMTERDSLEVDGKVVGKEGLEKLMGKRATAKSKAFSSTINVSHDVFEPEIEEESSGDEEE